MENKKLLEEIRSYWNNRADGYSRVNQEELHSEQKEKWKEVLLAAGCDKLSVYARTVYPQFCFLDDGSADDRSSEFCLCAVV